jgi:hypothetical protein
MTNFTETNEKVLYLLERDDGTYEPRLSGATLRANIMWTQDIMAPLEIEVPVYWEGQVKKLPAILEQSKVGDGIVYIRSSDAWRFIHEVRDAVKQGPQ